jgi:hypothetical protein
VMGRVVCQGRSQCQQDRKRRRDPSRQAFGVAISWGPRLERNPHMRWCKGNRRKAQ